jgi:hypothetical protein
MRAAVLVVVLADLTNSNGATSDDIWALALYREDRCLAGEKLDSAPQLEFVDVARLRSSPGIGITRSSTGQGAREMWRTLPVCELNVLTSPE